MEDCFVAARQGRITLQQGYTDELLRGVDLLQQMARTAEADMSQWEAQKLGEGQTFLDALNHVGAGPAVARGVCLPQRDPRRPACQHSGGRPRTPLGAGTGERGAGGV